MVPYIPKTTCPEGIATLNYEGRSINIRATQVIIDITGAQRDSRYYGPDADQFDPIRWDASNQDSFLAKNKGRNGLMGVGLEYPTIHKPERGAFIGFSDGARGCLGRKFGQVEFVSIVSVILRDYRVELDVLDGETKDMAVARAWEAIERSRATIALRVREKIPLVLYRR